MGYVPPPPPPIKPKPETSYGVIENPPLLEPLYRLLWAFLGLLRGKKRKRGLVPYEDEKPKRVPVRLGDDGELEGEAWDVGELVAPLPTPAGHRPGHTSVWR